MGIWSTALDFDLPQAVFWAILVAAVVSWLGTAVMRWLAPRVGALDVPDERKIHAWPVPRLGGVGMWAGIVIALALMLNWSPQSLQGQVFIDQMLATLAGAAVVVIIGAMDDIRGLGWRAKIAGQVGGAAIAVFAPLAGQVERVADLTLVIRRLDPPLMGAIELPLALGVALPILLLVGSMNMMNFIDGVDGLAAGITIITSLTFAVLALSYNRINVAILAAALAGAALGFLPHNFRRRGARIFLGDSGSMLAGFLLAIITIQGLLKTSAAVTLVIPVALLAVPIMDTLFVIARRLRHRQSPATPDASHLHHRLLRVGYSRRQVTLMMLGWTASLSLVALSLRFVNFRDGGTWNPPGIAVMLAVAGAAAIVSVWMMVRLEIIKTRSVRERNRAAQEGAIAEGAAPKA